MPELPEVETSVLLLKKKTLNKVFVRIWAEKKERRLEGLVGRKIKDIERHGKGIFFILDNEMILFVHLRMTGHFLLGKWELRKNSISGKKEWQSKEKIMQEKKNGFLRFIFFLDNGEQLSLSDPRKFAKVDLISEKQAKDYIKKLGPDPLSIKKKDFIKLFKGRKKPIKTLLMEQSFISGIGNIYASEILFKSEINPLKKASLLTEKEIERIYNLTRSVLKKAVKLKGDSTSDFRLLDGEKAGYQNHHLVYNRKGSPCFKCKKKIERIKVGGRGTYFCPKCQK